MNPFLRKENIADIYPLSPVQEGMLFHALYAPSSPIYFEQFTIELDEDLDIAHLERAWNDLIAANPILRTVFRWKRLEKPVQVVLKEYPISLSLHRLDTVDDRHQHALIEKFLNEDRARPFILDEGPLVRVSLLHLGNSRYLLVWSFHHIILDGWSLPILIHDLVKIYGLRCQNKPLAPSARRPYHDYIAWLARQDSKTAQAFWSKLLAGFDSPTQLPIIARRDGREFGDQSTEELTLSEQDTAALATISRKGRHTLNVLVQAAWAILLSRLSDQRDIVYGTTLSGRPVDLPGAEEMVGLFINTLPIRLTVTARKKLSTLLDELQEQLVKLQQFQFSHLSEIQSLSRVQNGAALFDTILVFENFPSVDAAALGPNAIKIRRVAYKEMTNYPLTIVASTHGGKLTLRFLYAHELIDNAAMLRLVGHMQRLLHSIVANHGGHAPGPLPSLRASAGCRNPE